MESGLGLTPGQGLEPKLKRSAEAITLRLGREMIEALDDRRRLEPDLPTRPEMIRRLLQSVLAGEPIE